MEQGGDADDCQSTPEAEQMASAFGDEKKKLLPKQGEVDFINGGPPCQVLNTPYFCAELYSVGEKLCLTVKVCVLNHMWLDCRDFLE